MQHQGENNDLEFCLSFDCYFSDSITASAAAKVIRELKHEQVAKFNEFSSTDVNEDVDHFEFNHDFSSDQQIAISNGNVVEEVNNVTYVNNQLQKLSIDEHEVSESNESKPNGIFCLWRSKNRVESPSTLAKCKNNTSGSHGSRSWMKSVLFFGSRKTQASKIIRQLVNTEEVAKVGKMKTGKSSPSSCHELFYVQKRAERKGDKLKSFLPYKQDLLGFFVIINRFRNKKLLF